MIIHKITVEPVDILPFGIAYYVQLVQGEPEVKQLLALLGVAGELPRGVSVSLALM